MSEVTRASCGALKNRLQKKTRRRRQDRKARTDVQRLIGKAGRNDLIPGLNTELIELDTLKPAKRQTRKILPAHLEQVIRCIQVFGIVVPLIIDAGNRIIDGHVVAEAARQLGIAKVWCVRLEHLSEDECRLLRLALNRTAETGEWDIEELRIEFLAIEEAGLDLSASGFTGPELDVLLLGDETGDTDEDIPEPEEASVSKTGDLWQLGPHLLLCGDALEAASYDRLLAGTAAHAIFSDSPYNIEIEGKVSGLGKHKHKDFIMGCGEMSDAEFRTFLATWLGHCQNACDPGSVIYACMDWRQQHLLRLAGEDADLSHINTAVWDKGAGGMGALYRSAHELILVFCKGKSPRTNNVQLGKHGRDRTNVWAYPGANRPGNSAAEALHLHATPKPVELVEDALLDVTNRGDIVLDPFMGSGTTIIAAERCGRLARGLELDPRFVDVAIRRWQNFTGEAAVHIETGMTFAELAENADPEEVAVQSIAQEEGGAK